MTMSTSVLEKSEANQTCCLHREDFFQAFAKDKKHQGSMEMSGWQWSVTGMYIIVTL